MNNLFINSEVSVAIVHEWRNISEQQNYVIYLSVLGVNSEHSSPESRTKVSQLFPISASLCTLQIIRAQFLNINVPNERRRRL
jgi:hypothetical protein